MLMFFLILISFMGGLFAFISLRKHLLSMLLSLEYMMLMLFFLLFIFFINFSMEIYMMMVFMIFMVCEGALGLSILVLMIRTHGSNYFQSFNILMC